ncbi:hypothetical protein KFE25_004759 [Diacronema lutheri]|uniref:Uncharacterized protein n=1 Tax=Diacronema lutheri TaxID=2081491 RepID=A0A8J5XAA4_DIALT|nr:hypothetical protein KFE25_004759 [Diacronema lutheri]
MAHVLCALAHVLCARALGEPPPHPALAPVVFVPKAALPWPVSRLVELARERGDAQRVAALATHALAPAAQARALLFATSEAMRCAFSRLFGALERGERVTVVAIGGSVTAGLTYGRTEAAWTYHAQLGAWLRARWPNATIDVRNLAVAAADSAELEPCVLDGEGVPLSSARLVLVESAANWPSRHAGKHRVRAAPADYERLVRKLLLTGAALVAIATPLFWANATVPVPPGEPVSSPYERMTRAWPLRPLTAPTGGREGERLRVAFTPFEATFESDRRGLPEVGIAQVACHYAIPAALLRAAYADSLGIGGAHVARIVARRCGGASEADAALRVLASPEYPPPPTTAAGTLSLLSLMRDRVHPTEHGHCHVAAVVVAALQRALRAHLRVAQAQAQAPAPAAVRDGGGCRSRGAGGALDLPPPLFKRNYATRATCARAAKLRSLGRTFPALARVPDADPAGALDRASGGFAWLVEKGADGVSAKPGFVATAPNASLALLFEMPARSDSASDERELAHALAQPPRARGAVGARSPLAAPSGEARAPAQPPRSSSSSAHAIVYLLSSWVGRMGSAALSCVGACSCERHCAQKPRACIHQGHVRAGQRHVSVAEPHLLAVHRRTQPPPPIGAQCFILVRTLPETASGGHTVKVSALMSRGSASND